jgi:hypothetical protein
MGRLEVVSSAKAVVFDSFIKCFFLLYSGISTCALSS